MKIPVQENVFTLEITVCYLHAMTVLDRLADFTEKPLRYIVREHCVFLYENKNTDINKQNAILWSDRCLVTLIKSKRSPPSANSINMYTLCMISSISWTLIIFGWSSFK